MTFRAFWRAHHSPIQKITRDSTVAHMFCSVNLITVGAA